MHLDKSASMPLGCIVQYSAAHHPRHARQILDTSKTSRPHLLLASLAAPGHATLFLFPLFTTTPAQCNCFWPLSDGCCPCFFRPPLNTIDFIEFAHDGLIRERDTSCDDMYACVDTGRASSIPCIVRGRKRERRKEGKKEKHR